MQRRFAIRTGIASIVPGLLSLLLSIPSPVHAAPAITEVTITDVTTRSFSVVWVSDVAAEAGLRVFSDINGTDEISSELTFEPHPLMCGVASIREAAENRGVMKVRVLGGETTKLEAGQSYYFQTITTGKNSGEVTGFPELGSLLSVTLETLTVRTKADGQQILPVTNDLCRKQLFDLDGESPAPGALLVGWAEGASYPVSSFAGDCIQDPSDPDATWAYLDLNNVFSLETRENMELGEDDFLKLSALLGSAGKRTSGYAVAQNSGMAEIKDPGLLAQSFQLIEGWNMMAFQIEPENPDINTVLSPVLDDLNSIWHYEAVSNRWRKFIPDGPPFANDLKEIHANVGYWVNMKSATDYECPEKGVVPMNPIPLAGGWNLVGYYAYGTFFSPSYQEVPSVFGSIEASLVSAWTYGADKKWKKYLPDGPPFANDLKKVVPGMGLWISMAEVGDWE